MAETLCSGVPSRLSIPLSGDLMKAALSLFALVPQPGKEEEGSVFAPKGLFNSL